MEAILSALIAGFVALFRWNAQLLLPRRGVMSSLEFLDRTRSIQMADRQAAGRSPSNVSVQLDTLIKAARALGKEIEVKIKRAHKKAA